MLSRRIVAPCHDMATAAIGLPMIARTQSQAKASSSFSNLEKSVLELDYVTGVTILLDETAASDEVLAIMVCNSTYATQLACLRGSPRLTMQSFRCHICQPNGPHTVYAQIVPRAHTHTHAHTHTRTHKQTYAHTHSHKHTHKHTHT
mmetsp:Transcript_33823/g.54593  ORF Transcript_33823/g.54593 Transcript_33823/m.54593 type:complete len:147 (-) Transcript_33823:18-458(-)